MPDASTQTTKGKNIFLLPKKKEEEPMCWTCNVCPATHRTYRDDLGDYELTCDECHKDEYPEEYEDEDEDEMKEICIFEAWDRKYGANVAEKDKETEFQKKRHLFSDAYDKQEEEEGVFTCECCGTADIDDVDGVDCPRCDFAVCDECMVCDENDGNCKTDRCKKCDEEEGTNITDLVVSVLQGDFAREGKKKKPFDVYEGDDGVKIMCFKTDETHFAETQIFRYYDEKKWWLKHKTDDYFLLIETKRIIKKKNLFAKREGKKKKIFVIDSA